MQVVVIPVLVGSFFLQSVFPQVVNVLVPFTPLLVVLMSFVLACKLMQALGTRRADENGRVAK